MTASEKQLLQTLIVRWRQLAASRRVTSWQNASPVSNAQDECARELSVILEVMTVEG